MDQVARMKNQHADGLMDQRTEFAIPQNSRTFGLFPFSSSKAHFPNYKKVAEADSTVRSRFIILQKKMNHEQPKLKSNLPNGKSKKSVVRSKRWVFLRYLFLLFRLQFFFFLRLTILHSTFHTLTIIYLLKRDTPFFFLQHCWRKEPFIFNNSLNKFEIFLNHVLFPLLRKIDTRKPRRDWPK